MNCSTHCPILRSLGVSLIKAEKYPSVKSAGIDVLCTLLEELKDVRTATGEVAVV